LRVLLTGFGPFGEHEVNASIVAARRVAERGVAGLDVEVVELPVEREAADRILFETLHSVRPDALVMFGIDERASDIHVERIAINLDDYRIPDNSGAQPRDTAIEPTGPPAYFSTLPVRAIADRLAEEGIASRISNSAGTYLCNHVFYSALHRIVSDGLECRGGFVHIPQMSEVAGLESPSMPLDEIIAAIESILHTLQRSGNRELASS
jgi:pyroglutamyl-peptidase